jgi:signal transduction histidine kinase
MLEDWRFQDSPHVEVGGLHAYAGAPLRLQNESEECVGLGSLCVASSKAQEPLTKAQQNTLARLADWIVSDIIQCARLRRQRERRRMAELISLAQLETEDAVSEEPVFGILRTTYPDAKITLQSSRVASIEIEGRDPILPCHLEGGLWEDIDYIDDFITNSNNQEFPSTRVIRVIAAQCESISGPSILVVASRDFRFVFDDVDAWFVQACAAMLSQIWHKRLLNEAMRAKEKFLRGFSHQLRTPIHGILGSVELLAEELKSRNTQETSYLVPAVVQVSPAKKAGEPSIYLDTIKTAGRDLISIVNSMITLNRWADIAMGDRNYVLHTTHELEAKLVDEILKAVSGDARYKASVIFHRDLPPGLESFRIDLDLLLDCLLPLIINAIQNSTDGVVSVTTSLRPDTKELSIDIEDTGCGIHPDHQDRIFESYEKIGIHSTGAGLGLTLSCKFATLLNGSVALVSSTVDQGSHFRATFAGVESVSLSDPPQLLFVSKLKDLPPRFRKLPSSLDNLSLCDYFTRYLTRQGYTQAENAEECFIILDRASDLEQHQKDLLEVLPGQVAICLVPDSGVEVHADENSRNIVYINGPFWTSTMGPALEKADRLLSEIRASNTCKGIGGASLKSPNTHTKEIHPTTNLADEEKLTSQIAPADLVHSALEVITLPIRESGAIPISSTESIIPKFPALSACAKPTVLLVDDNVVNLRIMQMYCKTRGLPYYGAADGLQAIDVFTRHQMQAATGDRPMIELIMMDLQMPLCDGIEASRQIRLLEQQQSWPQSTLFIVTGQDSPTDRSDAKTVAAHEYFVKPVGINLLDSGVKRYFPAFIYE